MKKDEFKPPKKLPPSETVHMLAGLYANNEFREYLTNAKNIQINSLKKIKTGSIEGDALELSYKNGRVSILEELLYGMANAYQDIAKLKRTNVLNKVEAIEL